jgi:hypothetical protein
LMRRKPLFKKVFEDLPAIHRADVINS